ncbi:hypothetical protein ACFX1Q_040924 [Malus domestica]
MTVMFETHEEKLAVCNVIKWASLNNMMCFVFCRKYELEVGAAVDSEVEELKGLVDEGYDLLGMLNWSNHLPWLADFDAQKIRFRCSNLVPKVNRFISRIISKHRTGLKFEKDEKAPNFVDVLISLQGIDKLSDTDMIAVLWEMIFRGTDTVAVLIEWILARMRAVEETDISQLVYLTAVVKKVLRMHPPGPLLSWARLAITDTMIDGYHVPAGTTTMVNMWEISRDPEFWPDPLQFKPERFMPREGEHEFLVFGSDLRLALFGSGRQTCPGKAMGLTTVKFWVASLLHEYEWQPSDGNTVDLLEVLRLSCEMASPLVAKVRPRRSRVTITH